MLQIAFRPKKQQQQQQQNEIVKRYYLLQFWISWRDLKRESSSNRYTFTKLILRKRNTRFLGFQS